VLLAQEKVAIPRLQAYQTYVKPLLIFTRTSLVRALTLLG
jgi:hypothetical protein